MMRKPSFVVIVVLLLYDDGKPSLENGWSETIYT